jgi:hypothetical protein
MATTRKTPPRGENMRAPLDGQRGDSNGVTITENVAHQWRGDQENNQIGSRRDAMTTTTTMTKGADDHDKEDPSEGKKYAGAARWAGG